MHELGAKVIGYVEKEGSLLYEKCDYVISTVGGEYYFWYTLTLRFMANAGQFPKYDQFMKEIQNMPENVVNIYMIPMQKLKNLQTNTVIHRLHILWALVTLRIGLHVMECVLWKKCSGCVQDQFQQQTFSMARLKLLKEISR